MELDTKRLLYPPVCIIFTDYYPTILFFLHLCAIIIKCSGYPHINFIYYKTEISAAAGEIVVGVRAIRWA